jgi:uncharacterized alpha-E superfamily protein
MISRIADHCFWFGRYIERAESTARGLVATRNLALDAELDPTQCWRPVLIVSGEEARFNEHEGPAACADGERVERYMTWEEQNLSCLRSTINAARLNARAIRDVLSLEAFETTNELYLWIASPAAREEFNHNRFGFYRKIRQSCQLCLGLLRSTMLHDTPLDMIWLGVLLERVSQTARLLDVHHYAVQDLEESTADAVWLSLLRACSGFESYLKRSHGKVTGLGVASFLFGEPQFPRSVHYCVRSSFERFCAIRPPAEAHLPGQETYTRFLALDTWLSQQMKAPLELAQLHELLTHVVNESSEICQGLATELFGYS